MEYDNACTIILLEVSSFMLSVVTELSVSLIYVSSQLLFKKNVNLGLKSYSGYQIDGKYD